MSRAPVELPPLAGYTVAVTAARRADELGTLLESRGASVLYAPAIRIVPLAGDAELIDATRRCIDRAPDVVVATTGIGFRGWVEAADGWGLSERLLRALRSARLLARGPKARGAVRAAGLPDPWSPDSESSGEVLDELLTDDLDGRRIVVQLHGEPLPHFSDALRCAGAEVVEVPVYRWEPPADPEPLRRLIDMICQRGVDAVTFTSAPAAASLLASARKQERESELLAALSGPVVTACVGPVAARPLRDRGVPGLVPSRYRLGALVHKVAEALPEREIALPVAGHELRLRGHLALVDGDPRPISPTGMALLRMLASDPGRTVSRAALLSAVYGADSPPSAEHAVESAIARLRSALGAPRLVQTVIKRGYRLPLEPVTGARCSEEGA